MSLALYQWAVPVPVIGIVHENDFFLQQWNFLWKNQRVLGGGGERNQWYEKEKKGSTGFCSVPNTQKTNRAHSHAAITHLGCVIVNTVTCCYSRRLATGLNAVIPTRFRAVSAKKKWKFWKRIFRVFLWNQFPCLLLEFTRDLLNRWHKAEGVVYCWGRLFFLN